MTLVSKKLLFFVFGSFVILFVLLGSVFLLEKSQKPSKDVSASQQSCSPLGNGNQLCLQTDVAGNSAEESLASLWPLILKSSWHYGGINQRYGQMKPYKLQIKIENPLIYEGQLATPVDFVKDNPVGYWGPDKNQNLRWLVVNFDQSSFPYMWAKGDIVFDRDSLKCISRWRYDPLSDTSKPAYVLFPKSLKPNPDNNGLTNSLSVIQKYFSCQIPSGSSNCDCSLQPLSQNSSWFMGVTNAKIKVPFFQDTWMNAKRVEFVELSLPVDETNPNRPYTNDQSIACQNSADNFRLYRGVREDWYFVDGIGPVLIITRDVGLPPDNECIYSVARESLTFQNADTYSYLVAKDNNGYDASWNFSTLPLPALSPTPTLIPTPVPTATPTPTPTPVAKTTTCSSWTYFNSPAVDETLVIGKSYTLSGWSLFCAGCPNPGGMFSLDIFLCPTNGGNCSYLGRGSYGKDSPLGYRPDTLNYCANSPYTGWSFDWTVPTTVTPGKYTLVANAINSADKDSAGHFLYVTSKSREIYIASSAAATPTPVPTATPTPVAKTTTCYSWNYFNTPDPTSTTPLNIKVGDTYTFTGWAIFCDGCCDPRKMYAVDLWQCQPPGTTQTCKWVGSATLGGYRSDTLNYCGGNPGYNGWSFKWTVPADSLLGPQTIWSVAINSSEKVNGQFKCTQWKSSRTLSVVPATPTTSPITSQTTTTSPTAAMTTADLTGDGKVDEADYAVLMANFGKNVPAGTLGDLTGDGKVDEADYAVLMASFGR